MKFKVGDRVTAVSTDGDTVKGTIAGFASYVFSHEPPLPF